MLFYSVLDEKDRRTVDLARGWLVEEILVAERCFYWASEENVRVQWKLLVENVAQFFLVNKVLESERNTVCAKELLETTKLDRNMWRYVSSARVMLTPLWMCGARLTYLFGITPEEEQRVQNIIHAHSEKRARQGETNIRFFRESGRVRSRAHASFDVARGECGENTRDGGDASVQRVRVSAGGIHVQTVSNFFGSRSQNHDRPRRQIRGDETKIRTFRSGG